MKNSQNVLNNQNNLLVRINYEVEKNKPCEDDLIGHVQTYVTDDAVSGRRGSVRAIVVTRSGKVKAVNIDYLEAI